MKNLVLLAAAYVLLLCSCESKELEKELDARETALNAREQELLLREKTLELKEQDLAERIRTSDSAKRADSTSPAVDSADTTANPQVNPFLAGEWSVKMTCVETSCAGSAVGDTRVERWNLSYTGQHLVAKAMDHGNLIRTYSGVFVPGDIELIEHRDSTLLYDTRMKVRLRPLNETSMEGTREIVMDGECKIVYALTLDKIK